jgi:hypothetical protein
MKATTATALGAIALVSLLMSSTSARADLIHWSYNWSRFPGDILPDNPASGGKITLTDESLKSAIGDSDIVATNIRTFSKAPDDKPDTYTNKAYTLSLFLLDQASNIGGTINFNGIINGMVSTNSSNLTNAFTSPVTQTIILGNDKYIATLGQFTPPGPPGAVNSGSVSAHVAVTVEILSKVPEPATMTLASVGVALLLLARYRTQRPFPLKPA